LNAHPKRRQKTIATRLLWPAAAVLSCAALLSGCSQGGGAPSVDRFEAQAGHVAAGHAARPSSAEQLGSPSTGVGTTPAEPTASTPVASPRLDSTGWATPRLERPGDGGDGDGFERPGNAALARDGAEAVSSDSGTSVTASCYSAGNDSHIFRNFGVTPTAAYPIVDGIEVRLEARADSPVGRAYFCVQLSGDGGRTWSYPQRTNQLTATSELLVAGLRREPWGRQWSLADLSDASFRVRVIPVSDDGRRDFFLDSVAVRVSYH
jgi:hypothetical protein